MSHASVCVSLRRMHSRMQAGSSRHRQARREERSCHWQARAGRLVALTVSHRSLSRGHLASLAITQACSRLTYRQARARRLIAEADLSRQARRAGRLITLEGSHRKARCTGRLPPQTGSSRKQKNCAGRLIAQAGFAQACSFAQTGLRRQARRGGSLSHRQARHGGRLVAQAGLLRRQACAGRIVARQARAGRVAQEGSSRRQARSRRIVAQAGSSRNRLAQAVSSWRQARCTGRLVAQGGSRRQARSAGRDAQEGSSAGRLAHAGSSRR